MVIGAIRRSKAGKGTGKCWAREFACLIQGSKEMRGWVTGLSEGQVEKNKLQVPEMGHPLEISYSRDSKDASVAAMNKASGWI